MSGRSRNRGAIVFLSVMVMSGLVAAPAGANARRASFDGSCSLQGTATFTPAATNDQQSLDVTYSATGTCTGVLNGSRITDAPVRAKNAVRSVDGSCMRADTTELGAGRIAFADGTKVRFRSEFHFIGTDGTFDAYGRRSGTARGVGSLVTPRTPPGTALQCAGDGVPEAPLDIALDTVDPLVSGRADKGERGPRHVAGRQRRSAKFTGDCKFSGPVRFHPALTNDPQDIGQRVGAPGTCSGEFIDRRGRVHDLAGARAVFREHSQAPGATCAGGTATGGGSLRFGIGRIRFRFSEARGVSGVVATAVGSVSGSARGTANVSPNEDPAQILQQCAGAGLSSVVVDIVLRTTPSIRG